LGPLAVMASDAPLPSLPDENLKHQPLLKK
jgi:hypothetical protein